MWELDESESASTSVSASVAVSASVSVLHDDSEEKNLTLANQFQPYLQMTMTKAGNTLIHNGVRIQTGNRICICTS